MKITKMVSEKELVNLNKKLKKDLKEYGLYLLKGDVVQNPVNRQKAVKGYVNYEELMKKYVDDKKIAGTELEALKNWVSYRMDCLEAEEKNSSYAFTLNQVSGSRSTETTSKDETAKSFYEYAAKMLLLKNGEVAAAKENPTFEDVVGLVEEHAQVRFNDGEQMLGYLYQKVDERLEQLRQE